jgi:hypothetical protein
MTSKPLSEERLEEIRQHILGKSQAIWATKPVEMRREAQALLAEIDRLRATVAAWRPMVEIAADMPLDHLGNCYVTVGCRPYYDEPTSPEWPWIHAENCIVTRARVALEREPR